MASTTFWFKFTNGHHKEHLERCPFSPHISKIYIAKQFAPHGLKEGRKILLYYKLKHVHEVKTYILFKLWFGYDIVLGVGGWRL